LKFINLKEIKMKLLLIILIVTSSLTAQTYEAIKVKGEVKYQTDSGEKWLGLNQGDILNSNSVVTSGPDAQVQIKTENIVFSLKELSAVSLINIKQLSRDELLLALAMEDMLNVPKKNENTALSTAVYGSKEDGINPLFIKSDNFGIKRLNGAVQLAESGMEESAILAAKETYRKYPDVKSIPSFRIFIASLLSKKGLYEEALKEFLEIQFLNLTAEQKEEVDSSTDELKKKLMNN